jgi:hypothetical protein
VTRRRSGGVWLPLQFEEEYYRIYHCFLFGLFNGALVESSYDHSEVCPRSCDRSVEPVPIIIVTSRFVGFQHDDIVPLRTLTFMDRDNAVNRRQTLMINAVGADV